MKTRLNSASGFSLIELMVVVAIIGILSAIAVPNFVRYQEKARQVEGKGYLAAIYQGHKSFFAEWTSYAPCIQSIGFQPVGKGSYTAGHSAMVANVAGYVKPAACLNFLSPANPAGARYNPPGLIAAAAPETAVKFTASAEGHIDGAAVPIVDTWTITDLNILTQTIDGAD